MLKHMQLDSKTLFYTAQTVQIASLLHIKEEEIHINSFFLKINLK